MESTGVYWVAAYECSSRTGSKTYWPMLAKRVPFPVVRAKPTKPNGCNDYMPADYFEPNDLAPSVSPIQPHGKMEAVIGNATNRAKRRW